MAFTIIELKYDIKLKYIYNTTTKVPISTLKQ